MNFHVKIFKIQKYLKIDLLNYDLQVVTPINLEAHLLVGEAEESRR